MSMKTCRGVTVITCRGSFRAMGETIGEALRDELQEKVQGYFLQRAGEEGRVLADKERARIRAYRTPCDQAIPEIMAMMTGIERGAALPEDAVFAFWFTPPRRSMFPEPPENSCSNIVFRDGPQGPLWGKNNDGEFTAAKDYYILRLYPDRGIPVLNCTYKGWVGANDMMNAEGVASGLSSGGSTFFQSPYHVPDRLWMTAGLFRSRTATEYARHLSSLPLRGKGYLLVTVDPDGTMFAPEIMPPAVIVRHAQPWMRGLCCSNCYQIAEWADLSGRGNQENARGRYASMQSALKESVLSLDYMQTVMRHHGEFDLCRHGAERHDYSQTEWSMIGIPRERRVLFCAGQPCRGRYESIEL